VLCLEDILLRQWIKYIEMDYACSMYRTKQCEQTFGLKTRYLDNDSW